MKKLLLSLLAIFLVSGMYAQLDDQPLLLYLDFEDETDIAFNDQDLAYDNEEPTAEYSTDAMIGTGAASFDGTQYIIFDIDEAINCETNNYTWAAWVKTEAAGGSIVAWAPYTGTPAAGNGDIDENDPHTAGVHSLFWGFEADNGAPVFDIGWVDLFVGDAAINDGEWHHVVLSNDVENMVQTMYIDGVAQSSVGELNPTDYPTEEQSSGIETFMLKVGYATSGWPADEAEENQLSYFTGEMDDFRMYGAALSADDVAELFALTSMKGYRADLDFSVFPNPTSQYIMIKSTTVRDLKIFNAVGQLVQSEKSIQDGSMISIANLGKGLYFVKSGDATQKLIVE